MIIINRSDICAKCKKTNQTVVIVEQLTLTPDNNLFLLFHYLFIIFLLSGCSGHILLSLLCDIRFKIWHLWSVTWWSSWPWIGTWICRFQSDDSCTHYVLPFANDYVEDVSGRSLAMVITLPWLWQGSGSSCFHFCPTWQSEILNYLASGVHVTVDPFHWITDLFVATVKDIEAKTVRSCMAWNLYSWASCA